MKTHSDIVKELLDSGLTQAQLGQKVGRSQGWVGAVLRGEYGDIKWLEGEALRKLHADRCPTVGADTTATETHQEAA